MSVSGWKPQILRDAGTGHDLRIGMIKMTTAQKGHRLADRSIGKDQAAMTGWQDDMVGKAVQTGFRHRHRAIVVVIESGQHPAQTTTSTAGDHPHLTANWQAARTG